MLITKDIKYVGVNDDTNLFEGQYHLKHGISYNSYVILDEKIAVMDTVDVKFTNEWLNNLNEELDGKNPDYLIVQHMEPDHSASIASFVDKYPNCTIVGNVKTFDMIKNFFPNLNINNKKMVVNNEVLSLGKHSLKFVFAPMVHWPEVMVSYDDYDKVLFSADGFGKFGALDYEEPWDDEARRYFIGIVGKYGAPVQNLLKVASTLDIKIICSLHGPVLNSNLAHYLDLYDKWSSYTPEVKGTLIVCASVYGNTLNACTKLKNSLESKNEKVELLDLTTCDLAYAIAAAFKYDKLVIASITYNGDIFPVVKQFINGLIERNYQKRSVAFIENGSWAPCANKVMASYFEKSKDIKFMETKVSIKSNMSTANLEVLEQLSIELLNN